MTQYRKEKDSMGEVSLPADALYGATTLRAVENFPISGRTFAGTFIQMFAELKFASAKANAKLGKLEKKLADSICKAADKVSKGGFDEHFPIDVFQT